MRLTQRNSHRNRLPDIPQPLDGRRAAGTARVQRASVVPLAIVFVTAMFFDLPAGVYLAAAALALVAFAAGMLMGK